MKRHELKYGSATLCTGGEQGIFRGAFFESSLSSEIIQGRYVDIIILEALEVGQKGLS